MRLLGQDFSAERVLAYVEDRLKARGLAAGGGVAPAPVEVEPRVDPLSFNLEALTANADATRGLPLETHREGLGGRAVLLAKTAFRRFGQVFINEALGRQRVFNGHVRDSYAQLSAELLRLRERVAQLESARAPSPTPPPSRPARKPAGRSTRSTRAR